MIHKWVLASFHPETADLVFVALGGEFFLTKTPARFAPRFQKLKVYSAGQMT